MTILWSKIRPQVNYVGISKWIESFCIDPGVVVTYLSYYERVYVRFTIGYGMQYHLGNTGLQ